MIQSPSIIKESPILFRPEMVRALLEGRKTQTRRLVKPQPSEHFLPTVGWYHPTRIYKGDYVPGKRTFGASDENEDYPSPYVTGDRLWVKETWQSLEYLTKGQYKEGPCYRATGCNPNCKCPGHLWRPSIFMPRSLSRITLEITGLRCERLHSIGKDGRKARDVLAEGVTERDIDHWRKWLHPDDAPAHCYGWLWESIHGKGSWRANPWVWVVEFQRIAL